MKRGKSSEIILRVGSIGTMGTGSMASASIDNVNNVEALIKSNPFLATVTQKNGLKPDDLRKKIRKIENKFNLSRMTI
ncbi:MAG TPA: hypothetical protein ENN18_03205 [Proteobacteria bacterium]|nr:hypothetical protein [Pseudomonadota bacterium]